MATENLLSTYITGRDASPTVPICASIQGGLVRAAYGYVTAGASKDAASTYRLCSVPSNARVKSVKLQSGAQGVGCTAGVGVYYSTEKGSAAIDATFFASAVDVAAAVAETEVKTESGTYTVAKQEQELWQALGITADPMCYLDIVITLAAATVAGSTFAINVEFVQ